MINIRNAQPTDAPLIAEFNALMAEETEHQKLDRVLLRNGVEGLFAEPSRGVYYVAEVDGVVAGQLMITYEWSDWRNGTFWWIQSVYVKPGYRTHGVFTALYRHIEQLAKSRRDVCGLRLYVEEHNDRAKQTYAKLGMHATHYQMYEVDFVLR